ncbi:MAG: hypothetical protein K0R83_1854, partial [Caulobacter sp.]|nr:hypothetical protein [Caulobacter sp.]
MIRLNLSSAYPKAPLPEDDPMPFPATILLDDLDGNNGYTIPGPAPSAHIGRSISTAGDINGDGIEDFIVSASSLTVNAPYQGGAYVVFGRSGLGVGPTFDVSTLDGTNGFRIVGEQGYSQTGRSVASAGDVNGDGIDDLMVSAIDLNGQRGGVYVVFGRDTATEGQFGADLMLSALDGSNGYRILGVNPQDRAGSSLAAAGDLNGDGIGDMIIGAAYSNRADGNSYAAGGAYVVFGRASGGDIDLATLDGSNGFYIEASGAQDMTGFAVSGVGDINDDGIDDFAVGAQRGHHAYVVYGTAGGYAASLSLTSLTPAQGFEIPSVNNFSGVGSSISAAGDFNADGIDDFIVGSPGAHAGYFYNGAVYVVFGRASASGGFGASLDLTTLDGSNGFAITGAANFDQVGDEVARTGDINADGIDDILLLSSFGPGMQGNGIAYAVFGRAGAGPAVVNIADLDGTQGFTINGGLQSPREIQHIAT